jgi:N-acetylglutamate synthase-like GNAT family acetyltransferase
VIVNHESYQAHFVRKYNLGIVIKSEDNLYEEIVKYVSTFNSDLFTQGCDHLNEIIYADICKFESKLISSFKIIREDEN